MLFCIFSFNRGQFLANCVRSIEASIDNPRIVVFDDDSYDEATTAVLREIEQRHTVIRCGTQSQRRLGGLYGNMQLALDYTKDEDLVCFLQDDTQMVRRLLPHDIEHINTLFDESEQVGFASPCFMKARNRKRDINTKRFDPQRHVYTGSGSGQSAGQHFSALLIMRPARLLAKGWVFGKSEPENDLQAAQLFGPMLYLFTPFAMWLPEVPTYRGKRKTMALRMAERKRQSGFFPFTMLSDDEVKAMNARPVEQLPVAEDFLHCEDGNPKTPWAYDPLQNHKLLKKLSSLELALRRLTNR